MYSTSDIEKLHTAVPRLVRLSALIGVPILAVSSVLFGIALIMTGNGAGRLGGLLGTFALLLMLPGGLLTFGAFAGWCLFKVYEAFLFEPKRRA